jgi:hypothetical protein
VVGFDPHILPGGQGKIVIALETKKLNGKFERHFKVFSNDPQRQVIMIKVHGTAPSFGYPTLDFLSCP